VNLPESLRYDAAGLVPVALQDADTREVLILAHMDRAAVERTLETGLVHLWSRSRGRAWLKGERSGRTQRVVEVRPNCELSSLLLLVEQTLPGACHTGHSGCYYRRLEGSQLRELSPPLFDPTEVYGEGAALPSPLAELLEAYAWLAGQPLVPDSGTSRALHAQGPDPLRRLREEWAELLGVLDGTHRHGSFEEDARLEAYQVLYWTCLLHVGAGAGDAALARRALGEGRNGDRAPADLLEGALPGPGGRPRLPSLWAALGAACREAGVEPDEVIRRDLADLRDRPYMAPHFDAKPAE
jgi:phosphoribosyl-AMP cyclohydrolase